MNNTGRPPTSHDPRPPPKLLGRRSECKALDRLVADALAGRSRVTVLRGEAGVGKSALLSYLSGRVAGWHVARAVGVESEMELAYAGLHQLCAPMLDHLDRLPVPQRDALATVFGRSTGPAPDRFLVGLATLTLFAEVAESAPSWTPVAVKRVYIPKASNPAKLRPLGIPVLMDRCHQARVRNALEPEWEARFEPRSYGFRPGRGCHDAIEAIYSVCKGPGSKRAWILDADLAAALDASSHCSLCSL